MRVGDLRECDEDGGDEDEVCRERVQYDDEGRELPEVRDCVYVRVCVCACERT